MISMFSIGALIWIPQSTRRWVNDKEQLQIFPNMLSVTREPMLGIFKGYTWSGECEVLCPDGLWSFDQKDIKAYITKKPKEVNLC